MRFDGRSVYETFLRSLLPPNFCGIYRRIKFGDCLCFRSELSCGKLSGDRSASPEWFRPLRCVVLGGHTCGAT
ncbi:hypothetical protein FHS19_005762 [Paenibacillus rhizosphaerae]|uniref:Uncharacterized protein n=1 Tax=Paenibacillus rhizosphaerae TaxID=297318 RepID=A0A839TWH8_9BACL|nr:hypothetical protein [Paenibacillus rhizosphaerae]